MEILHPPEIYPNMWVSVCLLRLPLGPGMDHCGELADESPPASPPGVDFSMTGFHQTNKKRCVT